MKSRITQQPLDRSYSNLKLKLTGLNQRIQRCQLKMVEEDGGGGEEGGQDEEESGGGG